ncbi:MAG: sulfurtransferase-like selenium metabolism protein YedF [Christensenellales bacterium]
MAHIKVNAIGDACPIPVVKATKALTEMKEAGTLEVQVDNEIAIQNLTRLADGKGLKSRSEKLGDKLFSITMEVADPVFANSGDVSCHVDTRGDYVVAIGSDCMGSGADDLGRTLMKGFIYAVSQLETLPKAILFYNGGAKVTVEGSVSIEDLKSMEAQGVEILTCGTCLNFYGLTDKLAVGSVTNMYAIVEKLAGAGKVIKP